MMPLTEFQQEELYRELRRARDKQLRARFMSRLDELLDEFQREMRQEEDWQERIAEPGIFERSQAAPTASEET